MWLALLEMKVLVRAHLTRNNLNHLVDPWGIGDISHFFYDCCNLTKKKCIRTESVVHSLVVNSKDVVNWLKLWVGWQKNLIPNIQFILRSKSNGPYGKYIWLEHQTRHNLWKNDQKKKRRNWLCGDNLFGLTIRIYKNNKGKGYFSWYTSNKCIGYDTVKQMKGQTFHVTPWFCGVRSWRSGVLNSDNIVWTYAVLKTLICKFHEEETYVICLSQWE